MGGGANLYSIEAISDALIAAGSVAARSHDEQQIIRGYLVPLQAVLHAGCVAFFPSLSSVTQTAAVVEPSDAKRYDLPPQIMAAMELAVRNAPHQTITSQDDAFRKTHLSLIPGACTFAASMWSCVPAGDTDFGAIGIFDVASRSFDRVEQQLLRTFALQLSYALKSLSARKQAALPGNAGSREIYRYIENTQFAGNVARDLTNPLTAIFGYLDLLREEDLNERCKQYLQKIQVQSEKMQDIVMAMHSAPKPPRTHAEEMERDQRAIPYELSLVPPPADAKPKLQAQKSPRSATGRSCVLVIQKSDAVIEFEKSVLSSLNAEVLTANTGNDAIGIMQGKDVHAVILGDEIEGEWRCKALLEWIEENRPELKERVMLTVSQQPRQEVVDLIETERIPFVTKPLQIMDLFGGMRRILGFTPEALDKKLLN